MSEGCKIKLIEFLDFLDFIDLQKIFEQKDDPIQFSALLFLVNTHIVQHFKNLNPMNPIQPELGT